MAHAMKAWLKWPTRWQYQISSPRAAMIRFLHSPLRTSHTASCTSPPFSSAPFSPRRHLSFRSGAIRMPDVSVPLESSESDSDSDGGSDKVKKSRNAKKREAQRAVRWGIELAKFSPSQIKRILRVTAVKEDVYDELMLVKRFGRDVREGKRRQFSHIGKLLRDAEPELMEGLIKATSSGDHKQIQALCSSQTQNIEDEEVDETEYEENDTDDDDYDDDDDDDENIELADRWFDGLVNKNIEISNEIYSLREAEFDRQELRSLVRNVQSIEPPKINEGKESEMDMRFLKAKMSLTRFLRRIAKQVRVD
ncbi:unnamed protein product [Cuscuta europaea]|uniref:Uncharacterized protein n=1 Tax=Cuscuta europaea TaxID=41803 RepID=A0A9P1DWT1_CUSEU|nr:unnamed protein product [Cuscuta europaea]